MDSNSTGNSTQAYTIANPIRGRINACAYRLLQPAMQRKYEPIKQPLFDRLPDRVLEIGPGSGANLPFYCPKTRLAVVEPNVFMRRALQTSAQAFDLDVEFVEGSGESIALPDNSFEAVVATLVLCSARQPALMLGEIARVLRPGGKYVFVEHVLGEDRFSRSIQRVLYYPWRWMFEGCDLMRRSGELIRGHFDQVEMWTFQLRPNLLPFSPHIAGCATVS